MWLEFKGRHLVPNNLHLTYVKNIWMDKILRLAKQRNWIQLKFKIHQFSTFTKIRSRIPLKKIATSKSMIMVYKITLRQVRHRMWRSVNKLVLTTKISWNNKIWNRENWWWYWISEINKMSNSNKKITLLTSTP